MNAKKIEKWDVQHHILPDFYVEEMERRGIAKVGGVAFPSWSVKKSLAMMKTWNISKAFLSYSTPGVHFGNDQESRAFCRKCNDFMIQCIKDNPEKFGGFASVPLPDVAGAIEELKYVLDDKKVDGVFLLSNVQGKYLGDEEFRPFFEELDKRKAVVFIHPHTMPEHSELEVLNVLYWWFIDVTKTILSMIRSGYHRDFKNITYILAHGAGVLPAIYPMVIEQLKKENPNIEAELERWKSQLYLDTAKAVNERVIDSMLAFTDLDHIVFASDFVWGKKMGYWTSELSNKGFSENSLRAILSDNSKSIFSKSRSNSPVNPVRGKSDSEIEEHCHAIPEAVLTELSKSEVLVNMEAVNILDTVTIKQMANNQSRCCYIAADIPEIWNLKQNEINRILRLFNKELAKISAQHPGKIKGFGAIQTDDVQAAIAEIDYCTHTLKLTGLCIYIDLSDTSCEQTLHPSLIEKLGSTKVPIMVHPKDTRGIPVENEGYLDAVYFVAKIFYSNEIQALKETEFVLTHTCGIQQDLADHTGALYYMQHRGMNTLKLIFDYMITKNPKGENYLKTIAAM